MASLRTLGDGEADPGASLSLIPVNDVHSLDQRQKRNYVQQYPAFLTFFFFYFVCIYFMLNLFLCHGFLFLQFLLGYIFLLCNLLFRLWNGLFLLSEDHLSVAGGAHVWVNSAKSSVGFFGTP